MHDFLSWMWRSRYSAVLATEKRGFESWLVDQLRNFGDSVYPALPVSFGGDTKSRRSLLSGVYARGSKISHTGSKCVTCRGLHNSEIKSTPALCLETNLSGIIAFRCRLVLRCRTYCGQCLLHSRSL